MIKARRWIIDTPVGFVALEAEGKFITLVETGVSGPESRPPDPLLERAEEELRRYFNGELKEFTVPFRRPPATPFVNRVHDAMLGIPYGRTATYGEVAAVIGSSPRAVGGACGKNRLAILVPCHRIVAASGIGGYSGDWNCGKAVSVKKVLLEVERSLKR